jgi:hypothetical protein
MERTELVELIVADAFDALELAENLTQQILLGVTLEPRHYNRPATRNASASRVSWGPSVGNRIFGLCSLESASLGVAGDESTLTSGLTATLSQLMWRDGIGWGLRIQGWPPYAKRPPDHDPRVTSSSLAELTGMKAALDTIADRV